VAIRVRNPVTKPRASFQLVQVRFTAMDYIQQKRNATEFVWCLREV